VRSLDHDVIRPFDDPLRAEAGFLVLSGNLFDSALMKTSVISEDFRARFLSRATRACEGRAVVFEGPEDYHDRINDPALGIDEDTILFIRNVGCVGYPGSAEVVNMQPPDALKAGSTTCPPWATGASRAPRKALDPQRLARGGGGRRAALLQTGDRVRLDLKAGTLDALVDDAEWAARRAAWCRPSCTTRHPGRSSTAPMWASWPMAAAWSWRRPISGSRRTCRAITTEDDASGGRIFGKMKGRRGLFSSWQKTLGGVQRGQLRDGSSGPFAPTAG
jgi:dihydroxyacid dehydratase/phosphogluconate dehydratase